MIKFSGLAFVVLFSAFGLHISAQQTRLNFDLISTFDQGRQLFESDSIVHLGYKPMMVDRDFYDTLVEHTFQRYNGRKYKRWLGRKLYKENFAIIRQKDLYITIDPLMNFQAGTDLKDSDRGTLTTNTRALLVQGNVTDKIYFRTDFYETQSYFPAYLDTFILQDRVVPGQGRAKVFKETGWDYPVVTGFVHFQATDNLDFQFGHDKLFIGHGYRSMLLSDNAFNFPYLRAGLKLLKNKINYHAAWAALQVKEKIDDGAGGRDLYIRKAANFNYFSFKPSPLIEVGLFEGVIWERWNPNDGNVDLSPLFVNPIPLVNSFATWNDSLTGTNLGLNLLVKPFGRIAFYGQFVLDNRDQNGFQIGTRGYDLFGIKGLNYLLEFNSGSESLSGSNDFGIQEGYTAFYHYNQPLAHTWGGDFNELVVYLGYRWRQLMGSVKVNAGQRNVSFAEPTDLTIVDFNLAYIFNPRTNLMVFGGAVMRDDSNFPATQWVYFGLKTNLRNLYYDF
ncbi:MAG TPA: hypothetical protein DDX92_00965 [Flavobacteriales bacterium]|jgi:hypothetical protein|nr:hypothetical protein [Flavobacteriales bacterium]